MLWSEKYRPQEFIDVVGLPKEVESMLNNMPHFLFIGKPGTGKTTTAKIIVKKTGSDCLMLNASDERGINVIRDKVKNYAMSQSSNGKIKIVFLDEADKLTYDAQDSLRNLMETYHNNCRFILTGNYENKFSDAIVSRCSSGLVRFQKADIDQTLSYLNKIVSAENVPISQELLKTLIDNNKGDIRKCVNRLQRLAELKRPITEADLGKDLNLPIAIHNLLLKADFITARQLLLDSDVEYDTFLEQYHSLLVDLCINKKQLAAPAFASAINNLANAVIYINSVISKEIIVENFLLKMIGVLKNA